MANNGETILTKENIIKIVVVLIVLAFILEPLVLGGRQSQSSEEQNKTLNETIPVFAELNAIVIGYENILVVNGSEELLMKLSRDSRFAFANPISKGEIALVLERDSNITEIARELYALNETFAVKGKARVLLTEGLDVKGRKISYSRPLKIEIDPVTAEGTNLTIQVRALVSDEEVLELLPLVRQKKANLPVEARVERLIDRYGAIVSFGWEERNIHFPEIARKLGESLSNVSLLNYTPISTVRVLGMGENKEMSEFAKNLSYVKDVSGDILIIADDFTDKMRIEQDFSTFNATMEFPESILAFAFDYNTTPMEPLTEIFAGKKIDLYRYAILRSPHRIETPFGELYVPYRSRFGVLLVPHTTAENSTIYVSANVEYIGQGVVRMEMLTPMIALRTEQSENPIS
ncbi:MAG: hypothetical protein QXP42_00230 [Candidatus Micrarchaeia archaeon]